VVIYLSSSSISWRIQCSRFVYLFVCAPDNTKSCGQFGMKFSGLVPKAIPYKRLNFGLPIHTRMGLRKRGEIFSWQFDMG